MENVIRKIFEARKKISQTDMKKKGYNSYSEYRYFTPDQIETLVSNVCFELELYTEFEMKYNEQDRLISNLTVTDLETMESKTYCFPADIPQIKATNVMQQIGGSMTFANRYAKMFVFGIVDNSLDPDTTENTKSLEKSKKEPQKLDLELENDKLVFDAIEEAENCKTVPDLENVWNKYPKHHNNLPFKNAVTKKKELLTVKK